MHKVVRTEEFEATEVVLNRLALVCKEERGESRLRNARASLLLKAGEGRRERQESLYFCSKWCA